VHQLPELVQLPQDYQVKPAAFVVIFPGNSKAAVSEYAKTNKITTWATYVDKDRSFEKQLIVMNLFQNEISLKNVAQAVVCDANGKLEHYLSRHIPKSGETFKKMLVESFKGVVDGAKWKFDPAGIPEVLKPAWRALEFGQYATAAPQIAAASRAGDEKVKGAAQILQASIKEEIARRMDEAKKLSDGGQKWSAYKLFESVSKDFKDYTEAKNAAPEASKLRGDRSVVRELQARTALDNIVSSYVKSPIKSRQAQGKTLLQQLVQQFPDTEAALAAKEMQ
jgi:hypothetical protein